MPSAAAVITAATAAVAVAAAAPAITAAAEEDDKDNDDPQTAAAAPIVATHNEYLLIIIEGAAFGCLTASYAIRGEGVTAAQKTALPLAGRNSYPSRLQKRCRMVDTSARVAVPAGFRVPSPVPPMIPLATAQVMAGTA